jgi:hypothetical protein
VYNASTGFITSVTRPANHGDRITLVLAELGIPGVDTRFASLREVSGADNMVGKHIANCTTGTLSFTADQSRTRVTLWLFDATNGSEYYSLYFGEELGWGYVIGGVGQNLYKNRRVWTASVLGAGAQAFGESSAACPTGLWSGVAEDGTAGAIEQANRAWNPFGVVYARITDVGASGVEADLTNGCFSNRTGPLTYQGLTQSWINVAWYALSAWRPTAVRELARRVGELGFVSSLLRTPAFEHGMILARGRDDLIFLVLMPPV